VVFKSVEVIGKNGDAGGRESSLGASAGYLRVHRGCYHKVTYLSRTELGILGG
jgi:hypothetical protein